MSSIVRRGQNGAKLVGLLALRRHRYSRIVQRDGQRSSSVFIAKKTLLSSLLLWIRRVNRACAVYSSEERKRLRTEVTSSFIPTWLAQYLGQRDRYFCCPGDLPQMILETCRQRWVRVGSVPLRTVLLGRTMSFTYAGSGQLSLLRNMCDAESR